MRLPRLFQVRRYTTTRPRTQAGVELYGLAGALLAITTIKEADGWAQALLAWSDRWAGFLAETTRSEDGGVALTHERLVKARRSLVRLVNAGTLFTYLDPALASAEPLPSTNNRIEGGVNAQLRAMLRDHRGPLRGEEDQGDLLVVPYALAGSLPAAEILRVMPTDPLDRRHLRAARRATKTGGDYSAMGRCHRLVRAP